MREGGEEIERRPALRGGHLGTVFLHEALPFAPALRTLRELDCCGARGERRQPDIVEVLRRILALFHAARRPPHRADAKALIRESIRAESNNSEGHRAASGSAKELSFSAGAATSALVQDDIPHRHERVWFESLGGWPQANYQALLARACALQEGIFIVQRLPGEIHLRHQAVALARDIEMNMRGPHPGVGASRIRSRLDGLDPVAPFRIGGYDREALDIAIRRGGMLATRVPTATAIPRTRRREIPS